MSISREKPASLKKPHIIQMRNQLGEIAGRLDSIATHREIVIEIIIVFNEASNQNTFHHIMQVLKVLLQPSAILEVSAYF